MKERWLRKDSDVASEVLELRGITKRFAELIANDAIDLEIRPGEIHCLLGENGAGKSTLMNILYGLITPDSGQLLIDGVAQRFSSPKQAMAAGIGMVHQHFMLVEVFSVAENLILGREPTTAGLLSMTQARTMVRELSERYNLDVDPDAIVEELPVGVQQRVEILKALAGGAKYLIFDEPTAVLTPQEIDHLMQVMQSLRDEGKAIVFITHKLREVTAIADRITVMRRGKVVGQAQTGTTEADLAELMVGRAVQLKVDKTAAKPEKIRLEVADLSVINSAGQVVIDRLNFQIAGGEILAIAGVQGNGQTELAQALLGTIPLSSGTIVLDGCQIAGKNPQQRLVAGLGFVPEDRQTDGLIAEFSIAENLVLNGINDPRFSRGLRLKKPAIASNAQKLRGEFDIRTTSVELPAASLSGGNQQKVVLARELSRNLAVLVASQPTRGVDVGAIEFLHRRIVSARDAGCAVLLISTELDEVAALADRIAVMYRGTIIGIVASQTSRDVLGLMMAGLTYDEASQVLLPASIRQAATDPKGTVL